MLQDIKKTSKHTSIYALSNIAIKAIGLVLLPLYTNEAYLSPDDFGALALLEATVQILISLLSFALGSSLTRWYWDDKYKNKQKSIFFTILAFLVIINIPSLYLLISNAPILAKLIFQSISYTYLLRISFITVFIRIFNTLILQLLQLQYKSIFYAILNSIRLTIILTLTVFAITKYDRGLDGIWEAALIGELVILIITVPYILKNIRFSIEWYILKEMIKYSYPLVISNIAVIALTVTDRYMLHYMSGLAVTGVYSLGLRLANTLKIIITDSIMSALSPLRMKKINDTNNHRFFSKIATYTSYIFILALICVSLFSLEAIKIITKTKEYWEAASIIGILGFAFLFSLLRINFTTGLIITKKTKILGSLTFISAILNIGLNLIFIPIWGIYGAAIATLCAQILYMILTYRYAQKAYHIPYEIKKLAIIISVASIIILLGITFKDLNITMRLLLKCILLIIFPFILHFFNFYERIEIENIRIIFQSWKSPRNLRKNIKRLIS